MQAIFFPVRAIDLYFAVLQYHSITNVESQLAYQILTHVPGSNETRATDILYNLHCLERL